MLELRQVTRRFEVGGETVFGLHDIDLSVSAGEYLSVSGPSGSGKSTLLNVLGLLDRPDSGEYLLQGEPTRTLKEEQRAALRRRHIGFVFQSYHLVPRMTARENIELPMVLGGMAPAERRRRSDLALERLGLTDRAAHLPRQLSGGQRQRVAIGRAIVLEPALLLADEPTGNLDSAASAEVTALLESLNANGITLLVVTHDPETAGRARRRLRMLDGRIVQDEMASGAGG